MSLSLAFCASPLHYRSSFFSYSFIYTLLSSSSVHVCNWRCVINTHCLGGTGIIKRLARKGREDRGGKNKKESGDQRVNVG